MMGLDFTVADRSEIAVMIQYLQGDLFDSKAECLVNAVNCEGVMGKGVAYQFKKKFPDNTKAYVEKCRTGELHIGEIHSYYTGDLWIVNFPTKDRWREPSRLSYIEVGLEQLVRFLNEKKIRKIAIPALGCGNGGLIWAEVRSLIEKKLSYVGNSCDILVYEPSRTKTIYPPEHFGIQELILLQFKMKLRSFNMMRIQKALFLLNTTVKQSLFSFYTWNGGPYSVEAEKCMKRIKKYQATLGNADPQQVYDHIWMQIISKKTEHHLQDLLPKTERIAHYVNRFRYEKKLEGVTGLLYVLQRYKEHKEGVEEKVWIDEYRKHYPDRAKKFPRKYLIACIDELLQIGAVEKNIFQQYSLKKGGLKIF